MSQNLTHTTDGRTYPSFTSGGVVYDTLAAVAARLAGLALQDHQKGANSTRNAARETLLEDLNTFARRLGAQAPALAVEMALINMGTFRGFHVVSSPLRSVLEELEVMIPGANARLLDLD